MATGLPTPNSRTLPDKSDTVVSPRAAVLYHLSDKVSAFANISSGFRAPTLNELYRQFRVGAILTLANDQLGPERLVGGEVGVNVAPSENFTFASSWYDNRVKNPVANVTTRRQHPAAPESGPHAHLGLAERRRLPHQPRRPRGRRLPVQPGQGEGVLGQPPLVGSLPAAGAGAPRLGERRLRQPAHLTVAATASFYGRQFDDDLNLRTKPGETEAGPSPYGTVELSALREIGRNFDVFFGVQNLFDEEYDVGLAPTTIGTPRLVNGGIRVRWSGR